MKHLDPPRYVTGAPMLIAGIRRLHNFADVPITVSEQWRQFRAFGAIPGEKPGRAFGVTCAATPQGFEYMSGVEVESFDAIPASLGRVRIGEQLYAVFTHSGSVVDLPATWQAIWNEWLPGSGYAPADVPDFELYDHRFDPATGTGDVEIWFPIRKPARPATATEAPREAER